jgi:phosphoribosylformylglycinamidine synthase
MLDLALHAATVAVVRSLVADDAVLGAHDVADGGLATCVAEMAVFSACGVDVDASDSDIAAMFDETPSRIVVSVRSGDELEVERRCADAGVPFAWIGVAGGERVRIGTVADLPLAGVIERWRRHLPDAFGTAVAH